MSKYYILMRPHDGAVATHQQYLTSAWRLVDVSSALQLVPLGSDTKGLHGPMSASAVQLPLL